MVKRDYIIDNVIPYGLNMICSNNINLAYKFCNQLINKCIDNEEYFNQSTEKIENVGILLDYDENNHFLEKINHQCYMYNTSKKTKIFKILSKAKKYCNLIIIDKETYNKLIYNGRFKRYKLKRIEKYAYKNSISIMVIDDNYLNYPENQYITREFQINETDNDQLYKINISDKYIKPLYYMASIISNNFSIINEKYSKI